MARTLTIAGEQFNVPTPEECGVVAGMTLDEAAARQLYQVRNENIRNNEAAKVKKALENGGVPAELRAEIEQRARDYTFSMPGTGSGSTRTMDPVERESRALARQAIVAHLREQGRKIKDVDPEKLEAELARIAGRDDVVKLAKQRVKQKQSVGVAGDINLGVE